MQQLTASFTSKHISLYVFQGQTRWVSLFLLRQSRLLIRPIFWRYNLHDFLVVRDINTTKPYRQGALKQVRVRGKRNDRQVPSYKSGIKAFLLILAAYFISTVCGWVRVRWNKVEKQEIGKGRKERKGLPSFNSAAVFTAAPCEPIGVQRWRVSLRMLTY